MSPKVSTRSTELEANNQTVIVATDEWHTKWFLSARFMYEDDEGKLRYGKNGINIRIDGEDGIEAAQAVVDALQDHLDSIREGHTHAEELSND